MFIFAGIQDHGIVFNEKDHAEQIFVDEILKRFFESNNGPLERHILELNECSIKLLMNYSPCHECGKMLQMLAEKYPKLELKISYIKMYKHYEKEQKMHFHILDCLGNVSVSVMTYGEYVHLFGNCNVPMDMTSHLMLENRREKRRNRNVPIKGASPNTGVPYSLKRAQVVQKDQNCHSFLNNCPIYDPKSPLESSKPQLLSDKNRRVLASTPYALNRDNRVSTWTRARRASTS